ncbi:SHOCT domain-containing protein [Segeticoccus rhizosphaerae]|uniref:SHOCT domain-containing protein n=1 Tax=Segeticoccus rhizosphaerae TaxID=1104777 RepID=UPI0010C02B83|nr:SHOCT domain-containing protein [Ornithinicoccus soli]
MGGGMMAHMGSMGLWALLWTAAVVAVLAVLAIGSVWLIRREPHAGSGPGESRTDPVQILKGRYAAGEIDEGEFERRLAVLSR